jgi:hypothetical protein
MASVASFFYKLCSVNHRKKMRHFENIHHFGYLFNGTSDKIVLLRILLATLNVSAILLCLDIRIFLKKNFQRFQKIV